MRFLIIMFLAALVSAQQYTSENDDFDVEQGLVKDPAKMRAFVNCFTDNGPCDPVSADFKKDLPEAVREACAKCTPAQKHILKRFLEELKKNQPQDYQILQDKLDKDKKFFGPLEAAIANA